MILDLSIFPSIFFSLIKLAITITIMGELLVTPKISDFHYSIK